MGGELRFSVAPFRAQVRVIAKPSGETVYAKCWREGDAWRYLRVDADSGQALVGEVFDPGQMWTRQACPPRAMPAKPEGTGWHRAVHRLDPRPDGHLRAFVRNGGGVSYVYVCYQLNPSEPYPDELYATTSSLEHFDCEGLAHNLALPLVDDPPAV